MRNSTSRALRATATVAGVAALGATFAGTAFAEGLGDLGGSDNNYGGSNSHGLSDLGDSDGSSIIDEPGLANFEMPGMGMGSRGMNTANTFDGPFGDSYGGNWDDDDYGRGRDRDDDCGGDGDSDRRHGDRTGYGQFQNPVECKDNNFLKNLNFNGTDLGEHGRHGGYGRHDWNSSYKSIGSRNFRTSNSDGFGDILGGNSDSDSDYGDSDYGNKIYGHGGSTSRNHDGDDSDFGGSGDGLSGHTLKLPLGT